MRRFWFVLLTVSIALVIALPAGAGKPTKPKPPSSSPVAATLDADLLWVHEAGDVIWYNVAVQNKTRSPIDAIVDYPGGSQVVTISEPRGVVEFPNLFSYEVTEDDVKPDSDIVGSVTVTYDGGSVVAETSTVMDPVDDCEFVEGTAKFTERGLCIWKPSSPGTWEVKAVLPEPGPTRPTRVMMTMRDGVPGNWCTLEDGSGGIVEDRLKGSESVVLNVFLPGEDGVCLLGGRGVCTDDDCYFAVGNPESFYLYTTFDGFITVTG